MNISQVLSELLEFVLSMLPRTSDLFKFLVFVSSSSMLAIVIGLILAISISKSNKLAVVFNPLIKILDLMPLVIYLVPLIILSDHAVIAGLMISSLYSLPIMVKITLRAFSIIPFDLKRMADSFNSKNTFTTLMKLELPHAWDLIAEGISFVIKRSFTMITLAGLVGMPGLGELFMNALIDKDLTSLLKATLSLLVIALLFQGLLSQKNKVWSST